MMAALSALSSFGAVIEMADTDSTVLFGANPHTQAALSLSCGQPSISMGQPHPAKQTVDIGAGGVGLTTAVSDVVMEVLGMSPTCINRVPHLEPCVPHDPDAPQYMRCKWTGTAGEIEVPTTPYAEWIVLDPYGKSNGGHSGVMTDLVSKVNCTAPPYTSIVAATGYDGTMAFANGVQMTLSLVFARNSTSSYDLPYSGVSGDNVVTFIGFMTPPTAPHPPGGPPPPIAPGGHTGPGRLFLNSASVMAAWNITASPLGIHEMFKSMCWSSARGDTMNSNVWHSNCNGKGRTLYIATLAAQGGKSFVVGGFTRITWAGGGYTTDADAQLFQLEPRQFTSKAGDGPHSGTNRAIYRSNGYGPTFGEGHDLYVTSNMYTGYGQLGHTYKCRIGNYGTNTCYNDWMGSYSSWSITESEMWSEDA